MIVMVLFIHSYYIEGEHYAFTNYVQAFISKGLCSVAVPMFFAISGLLFFRGISKIKDVFKKQVKRTKTILIPYLIWNVIFVLWFVILDWIPSASQFVNSTIVNDITSLSFWHGFVYLFVKPAGFHLWFLRDLIIFICITPALYYCICFAKWIVPILCFALSFKYSFFNGLAFFSLGGIMALFYSFEQINAICSKFGLLSVILWVLYSFCTPLFVFSAKFAIIAQLSGIVAIWFLYDKVPQSRITRSLRELNIFGYSFFVYVFHEPFFNIIKKIMLKVFGIGDVSLSILYLINPIIALTIIICIAKVFEHLLPRFYCILTGGR